MSEPFKHIFFMVAALCFFINGKAQDTAVFEKQTTVDVAEADSAYEIITVSTPKEENKFDEIAVIEKINTRKISDADINEVRSDNAYWYVNKVPVRKKQKGEQPRKTLFDAPWFKTLFWIVLIGGFVALLFWFLATSNIRLFRRSPKSVTKESTEEEFTENIFGINFEKEIQKAIASGDHRMAVRLLYLQTLKELSIRNLIKYTHEKTNTDYLFQLAGTAYYKNFFTLTRSFDYTWYGHFELSPDSFSVIQKDFINFKNQLS